MYGGDTTEMTKKDSLVNMNTGRQVNAINNAHTSGDTQLRVNGIVTMSVQTDLPNDIG